MKIYITILFIGLFLNCYSQKCAGITKTYDKFTKDTTYSFSYINGLKLQRFNNNSFRIISQVYDSYLTASGNYLTLLFSDHTTLELKSNIDVDYNRAGKNYVYTGVFFITEEQMQTIKEKLITDYRLFMFDRKVPLANAQKINNYAKCLMNYTRPVINFKPSTDSL